MSKVPPELSPKSTFSLRSRPSVELKIEMLSEAAKDARERAGRIVAAAGGEGIKELVSADMGVININPPNSRTSSWDGNNDTSSLEKDIITIVHASFELED